MRFNITTLGCKVNAYESEFYASKLEEAGFERVDNESSCDVFIVNTCTVTNTAAQKSRQKIHAAKRLNPDALCVVVGCYAQTAKKEDRDALGADLIIGAKYKNRLVDEIQKVLKNKQKEDCVEDTTNLTDFEAMPIHCFESKHRAFLKIEDGCNQFCSYCAIPYARGRERSLEKNKVLSIAKELALKGHSEIVLTGIHTGRYKDGSTTLADLLDALLNETPESVYYRISSIEITEVDSNLINLMKKNPRICHHLHIPIQSACNTTLERMNRPYTIEQFKNRIAEIRKEIPDISISTDVITGFVQESDEEFAETKRNLEEIHFSFMHVFPYSKRDITKAAKMKGHLPGNVGKQRAKELIALSNEFRNADMQRFETLEVLIETHENNQYTGYSNQYHPVHIHTDQELSGRIKMKWNTIENGVYIVEKEGILCD